VSRVGRSKLRGRFVYTFPSSTLFFPLLTDLICQAYARSFVSGELRRIVQDYNMKRGEMDENERKLALLAPPAASPSETKRIPVAHNPVNPIHPEDQASSSYEVPTTANVVSPPFLPSSSGHSPAAPTESSFTSPFSSASSSADSWMSPFSSGAPKIVRDGGN